MANGRHARGARPEAAQHLDPGPRAPEDGLVPAASFDSGPRPGTAVAPAAVAPAAAEYPAPTGRRRKPRTEPEAPPPNPSSTIDPAAIPAGTGRRRKASPAAEVAPAEPGVIPAPTGRRRKPSPPESPAASETISRSTNAPVAPVPGRPVDTPPAAAPASGPASTSHRRGASHAGARRVLVGGVQPPNSTALIAGAAAVAVAAVGAVGVANSGAEVGATSVATTAPTAIETVPTPALVDSASVNREQARASRARARQALADRARATAVAKKKQAAAAKARAEARARAERLAALAKFYRLPVSGYRLTAGFGSRGYRWSSVHTGLDFACAYGSAVRAVANGTIVSSGWDGAYGYKTVIRHADGTETWYAHMSQLLIRRGTVAAGDVIGRVGMTGNTTGPHLHFEVRINDVPINPYAWFQARGIRP